MVGPVVRRKNPAIPFWDLHLRKHREMYIWYTGRLCIFWNMVLYSCCSISMGFMVKVDTN